MTDQEMRVTIDVTSLPRFAPISYAEADDHTRKVYDELKRYAPPGDVVFGTFMRNPDLTRVRLPFSNYLRTSTCLPVRHREIAILRTAWNCGADRQWAMHDEIAQTCGLSRDEIDRIPDGAADSRWTPDEAIVLRAVDELHFARRIGDETWAILARQYSEAQLVELMVLVGNYQSIAYVMNSVGLRPPNQESPDLPRNTFLFSKSNQ
jgi:alkylhydroperoxidase family enzyme